jgi:hypothetical protein
LTFSSCHFKVTEFVSALTRLAAEYGRFDSLNLSPPLHGLQAQTLFAMHGSDNCLGTSLFFFLVRVDVFNDVVCMEKEIRTFFVCLISLIVHE